MHYKSVAPMGGLLMKKLFAVLLATAALAPITASSAEVMEKLTTREICAIAVNKDASNWSSDINASPYVVEAAKRQITPSDCHKILQQPPQQASKPATCTVDKPACTSQSTGDLRIQFQTWVSQGTTLQAMVSIKNSTNNHYARVGFNCEFRDQQGYKVGGGTALFYMVPKNAVTVDTQYFYNNGNARFSSIKCELLGAEPLTTENQRLYRPSSKQASMPIPTTATRFWSDDLPPMGQGTP